MTRSRKGVAVGLIGIACAMALPPGSGAAIPGTPSQWNSLAGLNAASGAPWVRSLAVSGSSSLGYAGLEGGGVHRSTDGGGTWSAFNAGFPSPAVVKVRGLAADGATVHAATDSGIWRSTGGAWSRVGPARPASAIANVPASGPLLAGVDGAGVWRSADGGETWAAPAAGDGMPSGETIRGLTASVPGRVYATGDGGVYVSADGGATWTRRGDGIPAGAEPLVTWSYPQRPETAYTATDANGVYRTLNGGLTWAPVNDGLGAVQARALQVFATSQGAHLYAATEDGLWHALDTGTATAPAPRWSEVTKDGLFQAGAYNYDMWALTPPTLVGSGLPGLIAGTRTNGAYFLPFVSPGSTCSESNPGGSAPCPTVTGTVRDGAVLTASRGTWTGTGTITYAYQWERCTSAAASSCAPIDGARETSYVVPPSGVGLRYRIRVTAGTTAPSFDVVQRHSTLTAAAVANPGSYPGSNQRLAPEISVTPPGAQTQPAVGDQMYAEYGTTPSASTDGWFNPAAATRTFQWLRCDDAGAGCDEIPGATARAYTLQIADGTHALRVRVRGANADGTAELTSSASYRVVPAPAAIGDPLPVGGATRSQAPAVLGAAVVGQTLAGDVGGWKDPTTGFARRWVRCDAAGNACAPIGSESGPTYVVRAEDAGSTLRLRVTADVDGDLADGGADRPPAAVAVDSAPTAVVTVPPAAGGPGQGGPAPAPLPTPPGVTPRDTTAPRLSRLSITKKAFAAGGKGTKIKVTVSERATLRITIAKPAKGRRVGKACKPQTKANRRRKACTYDKTQTTLRRAGASGAVTVAFTGKVGKRKLVPGRYTATLVATDAAGNASKPATLRFTITRR